MSDPDNVPGIPADGDELVIDAEYDAGDMSCGDLVLELRKQMAALAPGQVLELRATDPGAPSDLPAWSRLTRHALVRFEHPLYWIRRRAD